jgi:hypothetical protein
MAHRNRSHSPVLPALVLLAILAVLFFLRPDDTAQVGTSRTSVKTTSDALAEFSRWQENFTQTAPQDRAALITAGLEAARARRGVMESLIRDDPRAALEQAVTLEIWRQLPPELQAEVEEPFSALARLSVLPVCGGPADGPDAVRMTHIEGREPLETFVFGRRLGIGSKQQTPVQGIRLGGLAALREEVFQVLDEAAAAEARTVYPAAGTTGRDFVSGAILGAKSVTAIAGGKLFEFADQASFEAFRATVEAMDEKPGPHTGAGLIFQAISSDGTGIDLGEIQTMNNTLASAWTETKKDVFIIRCDFSDKPDSTHPVVNAGTYGTLLNVAVSDHIEDSSYGKTWIEAGVSANVIRLPQTSAYYSTDTGSGSSRNAQILADAKAAYQTANPSFNASNYDIVGVWFVSTGMKSGNVTYAGLASVGGPDLWIQGTSDAEVHIHEFGHNYGLGHSNFWKPPVGSMNPLDPGGSSEEYGDVFDVMGGGPVPQGVFHAEAKQRLNWLASGDWTDAATSGTYRVRRIDHPGTTGSRGLRVTRATDSYLWLSYRRLFTSNAWLNAGANLVWKRPSNSRSWLVDTTPGSLTGSSDRTDGSIAIGRTFSDGNIHITPLSRGGSGADEHLDIRVNLGPFPGNTAPVVSLDGPSTIAARRTSLFTAAATDADGDPLSYFWDFGQGFTFDNHPTAAASWPVGGTYTVKVTVSDMKGNTAQAVKVVTVSDPISTWTERDNASSGDFNVLVASPDKVLALGSDYSSFRGPVAASSDGITWTSSQLQNYGQIYAAVWDGSQFVACGEDYDFGISDWVGAIYTSPTGDAGSWTRRYYAGPVLRGIAFGNGVHLAVGRSGTILRSTNGGTNWSPVSSGTTNTLNSVAFGDGRFVAVGFTPNNGGTSVLTSPDGLTWTNTSTGAGVASWQDLRYVAWAHDRFLASGWYSKIRHSTDLGATFSTTRSNTEEIAGFAYGNGVWFATGIDKDNSDADVDLVSPDGSTWTNLATPALADNRNAAIFFNNTFITAGDNASIRQSGTISQASSGYLAWRELYFPDHASLSAPDGDADEDSLSNLLEYSLGRSPLLGSGSEGLAALPFVVIASEPLLNDRISLRADLPSPAPTDVIYVVEASSTLDSDWTAIASNSGGSWTWLAGGTSRILAGTPSAGRVTVTVGDSVALTSNPRRFLRLRTYVNP